MSEWKTICRVAEAPEPGKVMEAEIDGVQVCLANRNGEFSALDNLCPHRQGPLGQGWIEGDAVICPWHSWAFNVKTGVCEYPSQDRVRVFPVRVEGENVLIEMARNVTEGDANAQLE